MTDDNPNLSNTEVYDSVSVGGISTDTVVIDLESLEYNELELIGATENSKLEELIDRMLSNQDGLEDIGTPQALAAKRERERWAEELGELLDGANE